MTELLSGSVLSSQERTMVAGPQVRLAAVLAGSSQPDRARRRGVAVAPVPGRLPRGRQPLMAETGSGRRKRDRVDRPRIAVGLSPIAQLLRCAHLPMNDGQPKIVLLIASSLIGASIYSGSVSIGQSPPSIQSFGYPRIGHIYRHFMNVVWNVWWTEVARTRVPGRRLHQRRCSSTEYFI